MAEASNKHVDSDDEPEPDIAGQVELQFFAALRVPVSHLRHSPYPKEDENDDEPKPVQESQPPTGAEKVCSSWQRTSTTRITPSPSVQRRQKDSSPFGLAQFQQ